jgi:hypothetical protein
MGQLECSGAVLAKKPQLELIVPDQATATIGELATCLGIPCGHFCLKSGLN